MGLSANWIVAGILRIENGLLAEHWDVISCQCPPVTVYPAALKSSANSASI